MSRWHEGPGVGRPETEPTPDTQAPEQDWRQHRRAGAFISVAAAAVVALVVAINLLHNAPKAAASAQASMTSTTSTSMSSGMSGMAGGSTSASTGVMTIKQASLPVMQTSGKMPTAMAMVPVGQANWDGMTIAARTSAPATFIVLNGMNQQTLMKPTAKTSFHLMVLLSDEYTDVSIPYSSVWATITKNGKVVYDDRLWPMISRYMGPHYGNNVDLPSGGLYKLTLLVSPPAAARHLEYSHLWLAAHRVSFLFRWLPKM